MEHFFSPIVRYQNRWQEDNDAAATPWEYNEVELSVPVEEFLGYQWGWKDLCAFITGDVLRKILWITEDAFLTIEESGKAFQFDYDSLSDRMAATIQGVTSGKEQILILAHLEHPVVSTGGVNVFWHAVATSNSMKVTIHNENRFRLPSGPVLSQFLQQSPPLSVLKFDGFHFDEEHFRALATVERKDLEIKLHECSLEPQNEKDIFIEWFRHTKIVSELGSCQMSSPILSALSGNNSVKRLTIGKHTSSKEAIRCLLEALPGNLGIEDLSLNSIEATSVNWSLFFHSLAMHRRIKSVSIRLRFPYVIRARSERTITSAMLQMLHNNTVLHSIVFSDDLSTFNYFDHEAVYTYRYSILPRLEMNRNCFEAQRLAVRRADPSVRPQLLGRALHVVRYNPELAFLFLLENVPAFVRTKEQEEATVIPLANDPAIPSGQKRKAPT
jgi:hypothetical protein